MQPCKVDGIADTGKDCSASKMFWLWFWNDLFLFLATYMRFELVNTLAKVIVGS